MTIIATIIIATTVIVTNEVNIVLASNVCSLMISVYQHCCSKDFLVMKHKISFT